MATAAFKDGPAGARERAAGEVGRGAGPGRAGYTLFELLVVVAVLGIVASVGIPAVYHNVKKSPLRQAVSDFVEACRHARMMAILEGRASEVVIRAGDGRVAVQRAVDVEGEWGSGMAKGGDEEDGIGEAAVVAEAAPAAAGSVRGFAAQIPESVAFRQLVVNLRDMMDAEEARVRFYPNGTCDALLASLLSDQGEERVVTLEITTGRESVEVVR
ncbi:MAG TPA: type II secretion system protein [Verrucomicrobiota bacterium]|nr:type II secretion system protein [Verrucomicrobiota bacterium]